VFTLEEMQHGPEVPTAPGDNRVRAGGSALRRLRASTTKLSSGSCQQMTPASRGTWTELAPLMCSLHTPRFLLDPTALQRLHPWGQAGDGEGRAGVRLDMARREDEGCKTSWPHRMPRHAVLTSHADPTRGGRDGWPWHAPGGPRALVPLRRGRAHLQLVGVLALRERRPSSLSPALPGQQGPQSRDLRSQAVIQLLGRGGEPLWDGGARPRLGAHHWAVRPSAPCPGARRGPSPGCGR